MRLQTPIVTAVLLAAGLARAQKAEINTISKVEVTDAGGTVAVSIKGSKPPNFTTFSLMDPPRFVIDLSESTAQGVPSEVPVSGGVLSSISSRSFGSGASSIVRVMLAFEQDVDPPDIQTAGNTLVVRIAKPSDAGTAVAASSAAAVPEEPVPDAKPRAEAKADKEAKAKTDREAQARAEAKADEEAKAKTDREAQARAEAKADEEAKAKADREAQARAEEDARRKTEAQAKADQEAQAKADEETRAKVDREAKAKADREAQARAEKAAREKADAQAKVEPKTESAEPPAAPAIAETTDSPAPLPIAEPSQPLPKSPAPRTNVSKATGGPSRLQEVGFRQLPDVSRVFVRTNRMPVYTISESGENTIRVELANTRTHRRNDTRRLDTSFFPSVVEEITPKREGSTYVLEIKLKQRVSYQQKVEGNTLAIDFERPPGLRGPVSLAPSSPAQAGPVTYSNDDSWTTAPLAERAGSAPSAPNAPGAPAAPAVPGPIPEAAPVPSPPPSKGAPAPVTGQ